MEYLVLQAHTPQRRKNILKRRTGSWIIPKKIYKGWEKIIEGFKNGTFPLNYNEEEEFRDKEK